MHQDFFNIPIPSHCVRNALRTVKLHYRLSWSIYTDQIGEKMAKNIPYVLDQSTWDPSKQHSETNEALVDNWRPVGIIVVENDVLNSLVIFGDTPSESIGVVKELFRMKP